MRNKSGIFHVEHSGNTNPVTPDILDLIRHGDLLEVFDALIARGFDLFMLKLNYGLLNKAQAQFVYRATSDTLTLTFRPWPDNGDICEVHRYKPSKGYQLQDARHYSTGQDIRISPEYIIVELSASGFFLMVPRTSNAEVKCHLEGFTRVDARGRL